MHENELTERLIAALASTPPEVTDRFLQRVAGVDPARRSGRWTHTTQAAWFPATAEQAVLIAISTTGAIEWPRRRNTPNAIVDAAAHAPGAPLMLLEHKLRSPIDGEQLYRHARHWGLDISDDLANERLPKRGVRLCTWATVAAWIATEVGTHTTADALPRVQQTLVDERLVDGTVELDPDPITPATVAAVPQPVPLTELLASVDLSAIRQACETLYGRRGSLHVSATNCAEDAKRVASAFEHQGEPAPSGLFERNDGQIGNVATPRRVLSALYAETKQAWMAEGRTWPSFRDRLLSRGADRTVLLALLAHADADTNHERAERIRKHVARAWSETPDATPAADELHAVVRDASR